MLLLKPDVKRPPGKFPGGLFCCGFGVLLCGAYFRVNEPVLTTVSTPLKLPVMVKV